MGRSKKAILQRGYMNAKKHIRRCSSLIIREIQNKTTMRNHLILARMAVIKKYTNNKWGRGYGEKGSLSHCSGKVNCYNHCGKLYGDLSDN